MENVPISSPVIAKKPKKNSYIEQMEKNRAANMAVLRELGLLEPDHPPPSMQKKNQVKKKPQQQKRARTIHLLPSGERRKSLRIEGKPAVRYNAMSEGRGSDGGSDYEYEEDQDEDGEPRRRRKSAYSVGNGKIDLSTYKYPAPPGKRPQVFGAIPGVPVGEMFVSRQEANWAGVHRPLVAGISGNVREGVYSICMSGGYEDDVDCGEMFTYTGSGGRDLKGTKNNPKNLRTADQSKDQELTGMNLALSLNVDSGDPVRVMRGYKADTTYAPEDGYRYDGLYAVEKCWRDTGLSGFQVYKYAFKRISGQGTPPWEGEQEGEN